MSGLLAVAGVLILCLVLLPLSGWWLAARLRSNPLVRFSAACLAGVATLAAVQICVYALRLPQWIAFSMLAGICLSSAGDLGSAIRSREFAWDAMLAWGGTAAIFVAATLPYAVHGGGTPYWDWYEHWLRSLIFLTQSPFTTRIGMWSMAARGPLFNAASALLMSLSGSRHYWVFQIIAIAFNTLICLPFALMLETVGGLSRRTSLLVAVSVAILFPFFFWSNTFTWTKDLTAAYVLMGIYQYLIAYGNRQATEMAKSLIWFAVGFLSHYLALVYGAIIGLHLLYVKRRDLPIRELVRAGLISAVIVGPWFGYMFLAIGVRHTLGANDTVGNSYASRDEHGRLVPLPHLIIANLCSDLLPKSVCRPLVPRAKDPTCGTVVVEGVTQTPTSKPCPSFYRSGAGLMPVVSNGIYSELGYSGIAAVLLAAVGLLRGPPLPNSRFLLWLLAGGLLLNVLPVRWFDYPSGTFPENLHAWFLVLFAVVVGGLVRLPRRVIIPVAIAMFIEYAATDISMVREQAVVLPLAQHESALRGNLPLGPLLAWPESTAPFRSDFVYYQNYVLKIMGGAVYFRDLHQNEFEIVSWSLLGTGMLALGGILVSKKKLEHNTMCAATEETLKL
jgi:hypothetical protein